MKSIREWGSNLEVAQDVTSPLMAESSAGRSDQWSMGHYRRRFWEKRCSFAKMTFGKCRKISLKRCGKFRVSMIFHMLCFRLPNTAQQYYRSSVPNRSSTRAFDWIRSMGRMSARPPSRPHFMGRMVVDFKLGVYLKSRSGSADQHVSPHLETLKEAVRALVSHRVYDFYNL